jgi:hypothetical protein
MKGMFVIFVGNGVQYLLLTPLRRRMSSSA